MEFLVANIPNGKRRRFILPVVLNLIGIVTVYENIQISAPEENNSENI